MGSHDRRRSPGAAPLTVQRDHYLRLVARGMSNSQACREVGVNRKTGHRWRFGRTVTTSSGRTVCYPALTKRADLSGRFLDQNERVTIADQFRAGVPLRRPQASKRKMT